MPVEILHNSVGQHQGGDVVDTSVFSAGELRRLLDLGAVKMVPENSPDKPLELTQEQASIVEANSELSDRLDELETELRASVKEIERLRTLLNERNSEIERADHELQKARTQAESAAHEGGLQIRELTQENDELHAKIRQLSEENTELRKQLDQVQTSAPEVKQPKKK